MADSEDTPAGNASSGDASSGNEATPPGQKTSNPENSNMSSGSGGVVTVRMETLANVLTAAVAIAAILLSVWEGVENRRHNRLSVLPHLEPQEVTLASNSSIEDGRFLLPSGLDSLFTVSYAMENTGLGPAVLQNILVYQDGDKVFDAAQSDETYFPGQMKDNLRQLPFPVGTTQQPYSVGQMMKAGEPHVLLTAFARYPWLNRDSLEHVNPLEMMKREALAQRSVVVCYCSVYEEDCEQVHFGAAPPEADVCGF